MTLAVLPQAFADIAEASSYLNTDNSETARRFLAVIDKAFVLIERNPNVGRPIRDRPIREWSVPNWPYVIPYRALPNGDVQVLRVWHTRRNRPQEWMGT